MFRRVYIFIRIFNLLSENRTVPIIYNSEQQPGPLVQCEKSGIRAVFLKSVR